MSRWTTGLGKGRPLTDTGLRAIIIDVLEARHLANRRTVGKQAPFAAIIFDSRRQRTKSIPRGGQTPAWREVLKFDLQATPKDSMLRVECYADDPKDPILVGEGQLDLAKMLDSAASAHEDYTVLLLDRKGRSAGQVELHVNVTESTDEFLKRRKISSSPQRALGSCDLLPPSTFAPSPTDMKEDETEQEELVEEPEDDRIRGWARGIRQSASTTNLHASSAKGQLYNPYAAADESYSSVDVYSQVYATENDVSDLVRTVSQLQVAQQQHRSPAGSPARKPFRRISGPQQTIEAPESMLQVKQPPRYRSVSPAHQHSHSLPLVPPPRSTSQHHYSDPPMPPKELPQPPMHVDPPQPSSFRRVRQSAPVSSGLVMSPSMGSISSIGSSATYHAQFGPPRPDESTRPNMISPSPSTPSLRLYASNPQLESLLFNAQPQQRTSRPLPQVPQTRSSLPPVPGYGVQVGLPMPSSFPNLVWPASPMPQARNMQPWQPALPPELVSSPEPPRHQSMHRYSPIGGMR